MSGLSKLGTGLTVVFVLSLGALIAELFYVLWSRRRFRQQNQPAGGDPEFHGEPSNSKELLYFFCWKNQSRIEPAGAPAIRPGVDAPAEDVTDVLKWQGVLHGPSRVLFTIKEEEREDVESEKSKGLSLEECFGVGLDGDVPEVTVTVDDDVDGATPFSTPCASPLYYTPSPSPSRDAESEVGNLTELMGNDDPVVLRVEESPAIIRCT